MPADWALLPPGDATLTRRVKAAGPSWVVRKKRGRKIMSQGLWAPAAIIDEVRETLASERADPKIAAQKARAKARYRERQAVREAAYTDEFVDAVLAFLDFHPRHAVLAAELARVIAEHATPVGSGTVARTQRIALPRRAEAATIAWLRHQTTGYDDMNIPRVKGMRREVRRALAQRSRAMLGGYRRGAPAPTPCPLRTALVAGAGRDEPDDELL